jgi:imidazolonepropionase-like amidohydrolase
MISARSPVAALLPLALLSGAARSQEVSLADSALPIRVAVRAARLIDGRGGDPTMEAVVLIEGDRIVAVGSGLAIPDGFEVIDLGGATLLPGLIDAHTHLTWQPRDYYGDLFRRSPINYAVGAGVASIEHGSLIDDEGIRLIKERGTFPWRTSTTTISSSPNSRGSGIRRRSSIKNGLSAACSGRASSVPSGRA